jgi:adenylate kinase family enzyme
MERIAIVGCSGGGKSTLARAVGERLGLPVVHMDTLFWKPGWVESDADSFRVLVDEAAATERWVMDGGFVSYSAVRFARADTVIWVDRPMWLCLWRAFARMLLNFGHSRADLAPGCPERFDFAFYLYILNWNRKMRPKVARALAEQASHARIIRLSSDRDTARFLAALEPSPVSPV